MLHVGKPSIRPRRSPSTTTPETIWGRPASALLPRGRYAAEPPESSCSTTGHGCRPQGRASVSRSRVVGRAVRLVEVAARPRPKRKFCPTITTCTCNRTRTLVAKSIGVWLAKSWSKRSMMTVGRTRRTSSTLRGRLVRTGGIGRPRTDSGCGANVNRAGSRPRLSASARTPARTA